MTGTYSVRVGNGQVVEMTGPINALDKITMQMTTHADLLEMCKQARTYFGDISDPTELEKRFVDELKTVIERIEQ